MMKKYGKNIYFWRILGSIVSFLVAIGFAIMWRMHPQDSTMEPTLTIISVISSGLFGVPAVVEAYRKGERYTQKPSNKLRLFLSMQMSGLSNDEYVEERRKVMEIVYDLRKNYDVYFFNEYVQLVDSFDESDFDVDKYLQKIDDCDYFILIISEKVFSSVYFEAAHALARGKKSLYFVKNDNVMPLVMRKVAHSKPNIIRLIETADLQEIKVKLYGVLPK